MFADGVGRLNFKGLHEDRQTENCDQRGYGGLTSKVEGGANRNKVGVVKKDGRSMEKQQRRNKTLLVARSDLPAPA